MKYLYNTSYELYQNQAIDEGMSLEYYLQNYGTDITTFKQNLAQYSETMSEQMAVILAIYDAEGMTLTDEDQEALETVLGMTEAEAMENEGYTQECLELNEKMTKVILFVYDNAIQKPEETTAADANGPGAETTAEVSETATDGDTTETVTIEAESEASSETETETAETVKATEETTETAAETTETVAETAAETSAAN